jgi:hypothetical protein
VFTGDGGHVVAVDVPFKLEHFIGLQTHKKEKELSALVHPEHKPDIDVL